MADTVELEIRADEVKPGDHLAGLGPVQGYSEGRGRVTLHSGGNDWRVSLDPLHRVVVLRRAGGPPMPEHAYTLWPGSAAAISVLVNGPRPACERCGNPFGFGGHGPGMCIDRREVVA